MNGSPIDPERLGALLDGRLKGRERDELLAALAASPGDALPVFADALAVKDALDEEDRQAAQADESGILPFRARAGRGAWRPGSRLALAASVAAVALGATAWGLTRGSAGQDDPGRFAALLASPGLPAAWDAAPWTAARATDEVLDPRARAVRVGARLTDLEAAAAARDSAGVRQAAMEVGALLDALPASAPATAVYDQIRDRAARPPAELRAQGRRTAAGLAGEAGVTLGAWAEAARLATGRHDEAFFHARTTRDVLERFAGDTTLQQPARAAAARLRKALSVSGEYDWGILEEEATRLLAAAGS